MRAALGDAPVLHHQDQVRALDGAQAMGDDHAGAPGQQRLQRPLDGRLGARVDVAGGLVQDQDARVSQHGASLPGESLRIGNTNSLSILCAINDVAGG